MNLLRSASTVSLWTLLSRVTGLVRETLLAATFGASAMTDAFNVAFRIPNLFRRMFAEGAFSQAFIPVLAATHASDGHEATQALVDKVASVMVWVLLLVCAVGVIAAPLMVWAMASGLQQDPRGYDAAVFMTRFMFPYIGCMSLVALASGVLNTYRRFAVPAATPVLLNLCTIAAAWGLAPELQASGIEPIFAMAVGVMAGGVLQLAVQIPALRRIGVVPRLAWRWTELRISWQDSGTQNIVRLMAPALLGVSVAQISLLINTQIASHLRPGSVSWLSYADRLMEFPTAMLGVALGVVLMPQLSAARARGDDQEYSDLLDWGLRIVVLLAMPCAVALLVFGEPLVAVLFHYRAFTDFDVHQTALALTGWGIGLLGLVAIKVLAPGYYAKQDTKTPVRIAVAVLVLTQVLNWFLVPRMAHAALSMSIGIGALVNAAWLLWGLRRQGSYRARAGWGFFVLRVLTGCAVLAAYLWWAATVSDWLRMAALPRMGALLAVVAGGAVLYLVVVRLLGLDLREFLRRRRAEK